jgi:trans-2,3-dihydro-3-hydroxyanthranilate isomerase
VRIFTPTREIPFAGHPNVGTAFVLASYAAANGETLPEILQFEEAAGLVPVRLLKNNGVVSGAELRVPEPLSCRSEVSPEQVAACLSLEADCISTAVHQPLVASVGLPFLIVALASRDATPLRTKFTRFPGCSATGRRSLHLCLYPGHNTGRGL